MIQDGSIIQMTKYLVNKVNGQSVLVIMEFKLLQKDCVTLGDPKPVGAAAPAMTKSKSAFGAGASLKSGFGGLSQRNTNSAFASAGAASRGGGDEFQPVTALSPFQRDFKIKVRVTRKGTIREWSNP